MVDSKSQSKRLAALVQADGQRRRATLDLLRKKRPVEKTVTLTITDDAGEPEEIEMIFRGVGAKDYDSLVDKCPPTTLQRKEGLNYNIDKFAPLLISATAIDPELSMDEAVEIWESTDWNRGELMALFMAAVEVCTAAHEVPTTESD